MTAPARDEVSGGDGCSLLLAIDPGSAKCGLALVASPPPRVVERRVVAADHLVEQAGVLAGANPGIEIVIGRGTGSQVLVDSLRAALPGVVIYVVDEHETSRRARERYCRENPATGLRRLLPAGLRYPEEPYDDYVAIILAEDFLSQQEAVS